MPLPRDFLHVHIRRASVDNSLTFDTRVAQIILGLLCILLLDNNAFENSLSMFYSETLLSKTGPLARVWLSANLERKLSKPQILQSNIESSVSAIVDSGQAPMALRLSGQLLLGVVRIYSRKARYLMDDCNEALLKIKMVNAGRERSLDCNLICTRLFVLGTPGTSTCPPTPLSLILV